MVCDKGPIHSFFVDIQFSSTICWRDCPFQIKWSWHPFQRPVDHKRKGLFLRSLFYSFVLSVCFYASTTLIDNYRFVTYFKISKCESFNFVIFFQNCFGCLMSPWDFLWIFKWIYLFLQETDIGILRYVIEFVDHFE